MRKKHPKPEPEDTETHTLTPEMMQQFNFLKALTPKECVRRLIKVDHRIVDRQNRIRKLQELNWKDEKLRDKYRIAIDPALTGKPWPKGVTVGFVCKGRPK